MTRLHVILDLGPWWVEVPTLLLPEATCLEWMVWIWDTRLLDAACVY